MNPFLPFLIGAALLAFGNLAWRRLPLATALVLVLLPTYQMRFSAFGVPVTFLELLIVVLFVVWLVHVHRGAFRLERWSPYHWPVLLFLGVATASLFIAPDLRVGLGLWRAYVLEPILYTLVVLAVGRERGFLRLAQFALGALVLGVGLWSTWQILGLVPSPAPWTVQSPPRFSSFYDYPNAVGLLVAPIVAFFLAALLLVPSREAKRRERLFPVGVVLFGLIALAGAVSEGAWLGLGTAAVFLLAFHPRRRAFLLGLAVVFLVAIAVPAVRGYLTTAVTFRDTSGDVRLRLWQGTARLLAAHPIEGAGIGGFPALYDDYRDPAHVELLLYPHNFFLNFWVEFGLVGMLAIVWILGIFFVRGGRALLKVKTARERAVRLGALAAMLVILVHGQVDAPFFKNDLAILFWFIVTFPEIVRPELPPNAALPVSRPRHAFLEREEDEQGGRIGGQ